MRNPQPSWIHRILSFLASLVVSHARVIIVVELAFFVISIWYTASNLKFFTDRSSLVGSDKAYHHYFLEYKSEFQAQEDMVVVVESESVERNRIFVETLGRQLQSEPDIFKQVFFRRDLSILGSKALWFLEPEQIEELYDGLKNAAPDIEPFLQTTDLNGLFTQINRRFLDAWNDRARGPQSQGNLLNGLDSITSIIRQAHESMYLEVDPVGPNLAALISDSGEAEYSGYIQFQKGRVFIISCTPSTSDVTGEAIERLRELTEALRSRIPGVNVGITGEGILEVDEMRQSQTDSLRASILALVLVALIFIFGFHEISRPLKATLCLLVGLAYTMAYTTLVVGHLNILTITFAPILIGLAIDFGIHIVSRFEEERLKGKEVPDSLREAIVHTGQGILSGGLTTAGAFGVMMLTDFEGIKEMGIITGGGMIASLIPMMTLLPAMLAGDKTRPQSRSVSPGRRFASIERMWTRRPWMVVGFCACLCLLASARILDVHFDYNLLNMQSAGLPAVEYQKKLIESSEKSVLFAAIVSRNVEEAAEKTRQLSELPTVGSVDGMAQYLQKDEELYRPLIAKVRELAGSLNMENPAKETVDVKELDRSLWILSGYLKRAMGRLDVHQPDQAGIHARVAQMMDAVRIFRRGLEEAGNREDMQSRLARFQRELFGEMNAFFGMLAEQDGESKPDVEDLPEALRDRFIGKNGQFLTQAYPRKNVWDREAQEEFVRDVRQVDPKATGTPVQLYEYTTLLKRSYEQSAVYALIAIAVLVLVQFRNLVALCLSMLPVVVGGVWMVGFMGWIGIPFNPANIMTLPLIVGIGVTNGIHVLVRFQEDGSVDLLSKSTGKAVLASALTTVSGFGSLIFADHQGISSLGWVMSVGVLTCMTAGLTLLPACLAIAVRFKWRLK